MVSFMSVGSFASSDIVIGPEYRIVFSSPELRSAAQKLSGYIEKATGNALAVTDDGDTDRAIIISTDGEKVKDGFNIKACGLSVVITGSSLSNTVRGVYAFLEKYCGINCFTSKLTVYSKNEIHVPVDEDHSYTPYFEYTDTDWLSPKDTEYSLFNMLNGAAYRKIPKELGGAVEYIPSLGHTLTNHFCSKKKYFADHPEYFALCFGMRRAYQLCLSNPDVLKIVTDEVLELLRNKHDPSAALQIVSLTQADNIFFCRCKKCAEIDKKYGSHAGTMLEFVNAVARRVKEEGYDNVVIDTFAYRYTRAVPHGIAPEDNVCVRLCSIECCFSHALDDRSCPANVAFMNDLDGWSKICDRLYIWDYCTNYSSFTGIFPDFGTLQKNMQIFYEHNVRGIYEEGNYTLNKCDTEFAELRAYLITRLFKDPYCDLNAEREAFLNAFYGAGGKYVGDFLDIITENAPKRHLGIYQPMSSTLSLSEKQIKDCDELWKKAVDASDGVSKENVKNSELCWRYWKMKNRASEFADPFGFSKEKDKLTDDINNTGIEKWHESTNAGAFFTSVFQALFFSFYPVINAVLKLIYKA
ncbi:MAG: DUF4838 domain-containing protein [Clostridiales bacterium]|nr:DUF4838 domain-containing protein [Clostridiales bacterium]